MLKSVIEKSLWNMPLKLIFSKQNEFKPQINTTIHSKLLKLSPFPPSSKKTRSVKISAKPRSTSYRTQQIKKLPNPDDKTAAGISLSKFLKYRQQQLLPQLQRAAKHGESRRRGIACCVCCKSPVRWPFVAGFTVGLKDGEICFAVI